MCCECRFRIHQVRALPRKVFFLKTQGFLTSAWLTLKNLGHNFLQLFQTPCFHSYLLNMFTALCLLLQTSMCLSFAIVNAKKPITIMYTLTAHLTITINQKLCHSNEGQQKVLKKALCVKNVTKNLGGKCHIHKYFAIRKMAITCLAVNI